MVEEVKTVDTNTKTQLSLASALFFSPLVQYMLKNNRRDISDQDKAFIRGYIKFGYITLLFGIVTIIAGIMNYLFVLNILNVIYTVSIFILIFLLAISVVSIVSDISLLRGGDTTNQTYTIEGNKKNILLKYLPIYNIYLRYHTHNFEKPNWRVEESIILRTVFMLVCMSGNILASSIVLLFIVLRVAALMSDIDFFTIHTKQRLNILFFKNPEEMIGYITGFICYIIRSLGSFMSKQSSFNLQGEIAKEKHAYEYIIGIKGNTNIIIEYILGILIMIGLAYIIHPDFTVWTYYAGFGLLILRYLVMAIQLKHLPHLPIAREIMLLVRRIGSGFKTKSFIQN